MLYIVINFFSSPPTEINRQRCGIRRIISPTHLKFFLPASAPSYGSLWSNGRPLVHNHFRDATFIPSILRHQRFLIKPWVQLIMLAVALRTPTS
jgi:hypothetical protein